MYRLDNAEAERVRVLRVIGSELAIPAAWVLLAGVASTLGFPAMRREILDLVALKNAQDITSSYNARVFLDPATDQLLVSLAPGKPLTSFEQKDWVNVLHQGEYLNFPVLSSN